MDLTNEFRVGVPVERAWEVLTDVERIAPCMPGAQLQEIEGDEYRGIVKVKVGPITAQYKGAARFVEQDEAGRRAVLRAEGRETRGQGNANATITAQLEPDGDGTKISVMTDLTITGRVAQFGRGVLADVSTKLLGQFADCLRDEAPGGGGERRDGGAVTVAKPGAPVVAAVAAVAGRPRRPRRRPRPAVPGTSPRRGRRRRCRTCRRAQAGPARRHPRVPRPRRPKPPQRPAGDADRARANGTSGPSIRVVDSAEPEPVDLLEAAGAPVAKRLAPAVIGLTILWLLSIFLRRRRRR